jgi:hemerythrin
MEKIVWEARFNLQIDIIDDQHRRLVDLMNRLIEIKGKDPSGEGVVEALGEMTNYLGDHFDTEEQMMIDHGYPEIETHREEHQNFVAQTAYYIATYRESGVSLEKDILMFLQEWLIDHIQKTDQDFGRYVNKIREN